MNNSNCVICADFLTAANCTALPCGHTFHYECIMTWRERSKTCPQCRIPFREPIKLFFSISTETTSESDSPALRNQINDLKFKLKEKERSIVGLVDEQASYVTSISQKQQEIETVRQLLHTAQANMEALKHQLTYLEKFKVKFENAKAEAELCKRNLAGLTNIDDMVKKERHEVEGLLKAYSNSPDALNQVATSFILLKKEFELLRDSKKVLEQEKRKYRRQAENSSQEAFASKEQLRTVTNDLEHLNRINKSLQNKIKKLELAFQSPSPRASAIKRFIAESPAPAEFKRPRLIIEDDSDDDDDNDNINEQSLILIEDNNEHTTLQANLKRTTQTSNSDEDKSKKLADEFGLQYVETTSLNEQRLPLKDVTKNALFKSNQPIKKRPMEKSSSLAHVQKGFNGMGGQSKVLILPKRTGSVVLGKSKVKLETKKLKLNTGNNTKISQFMKQNPK